MAYIAFALVVLVAGMHLYFMYKEMCRWETFSVKVARLAPDVAKATTAVGLNQGLYNGFLAVGLIWSLFAPASFGIWLAVFFLGCVLVAGLVGELTISRRSTPSHLSSIAGDACAHCAVGERRHSPQASNPLVMRLTEA